jgi:hypothetical protein
MVKAGARSNSGAPDNPIRFVMRSEYAATAANQLVKLRNPTAL